MYITGFKEEYTQQVIDLILGIQNEEAKINLSLDEQPDLADIKACYLDSGGGFWVALEGGEVVGTIALMNKGGGNAALKKFFVRADCRGKKVGYALYRELLSFARRRGFKLVLLDTPSVAEASHRFYERAGFKRIEKTALPFDYEYPDRDSYLYLLEIR